MELTLYMAHVAAGVFGFFIMDFLASLLVFFANFVSKMSNYGLDAKSLRSFKSFVRSQYDMSYLSFKRLPTEVQVDVLCDFFHIKTYK